MNDVSATPLNTLHIMTTTICLDVSVDDASPESFYHPCCWYQPFSSNCIITYRFFSVIICYVRICSTLHQPNSNNLTPNLLYHEIMATNTSNSSAQMQWYKIWRCGKNLFFHYKHALWAGLSNPGQSHLDRNTILYPHAHQPQGLISLKSLFIFLSEFKCCVKTVILHTKRKDF